MTLPTRARGREQRCLRGNIDEVADQRTLRPALSVERRLAGHAEGSSSASSAAPSSVSSRCPQGSTVTTGPTGAAISFSRAIITADFRRALRSKARHHRARCPPRHNHRSCSAVGAPLRVGNGFIQSLRDADPQGAPTAGPIVVLGAGGQRARWWRALLRRAQRKSA